MADGKNQFPTYGLKGEAETRLELEFQNLGKNKADASLTKKFEPQNVSTMPIGQLQLEKQGATWYIVVRIDNAKYGAALTAL